MALKIAGYLLKTLKSPDWQAKWLDKLSQGALLSPGSTEVGTQTRGEFGTRIYRAEDGSLRIRSL